MKQVRYIIELILLWIVVYFSCIIFFINSWMDESIKEQWKQLNTIIETQEKVLESQNKLSGDIYNINKNLTTIANQLEIDIVIVEVIE